MTSGPSARQSLPQAGATIEAWSILSDDLLHGLVHALNNRVAALSAVVELARYDDDGENPLTVLPDELSLLHQVNALFALLPRRGSPPEALELSAVLDDALGLHAHHPRLRAERCDVTFHGEAAPVRVPRWAILRVLVLLVHSAKTAGESVQGREDAGLTVRGDATEVSVHLGVPLAPSAELSDLAALCGGRVEREGDALVLRLPTITELRRREREGRDASPGE